MVGDGGRVANRSGWERVTREELLRGSEKGDEGVDTGVDERGGETTGVTTGTTRD